MPERIVEVKCACPVGFPVERTFYELGLCAYVVIRGHSGDCLRVDEIVRFGS